MGIEAIGSIGSAMGSVAPAIGKGVASAMVGLAKFGPELKGVYLPKLLMKVLLVLRILRIR